MFNRKMFNRKMFNRKMFNRKMVSREMFSRSVIAKLSLGALFAALCVLPACSISGNDKKNGEAHVDIKSPVGDLHVSEQADIRDAGLTLYPGAKPAPKDSSDDKKSANVNLSLPGFSLKVVAAEFVSDDAPDKIIAYYNKELPKYGKPIQCHGGWNGGQSGLQSGLQSKLQSGIQSGIQSGQVNYEGKDDLSKPVACGNDSSGDAVELKVGTGGNQHIVSVKPSGHGSRFALVYVRIHTGKDDTI
ncbi:MAG: hypothetical protein ABSA54_15545 [Terriglobales bacterium]|jgi:hypothetical protein